MASGFRWVDEAVASSDDQRTLGRCRRERVDVSQRAEREDRGEERWMMRSPGLKDETWQNGDAGPWADSAAGSESIGDAGRPGDWHRRGLIGAVVVARRRGWSAGPTSGDAVLG